MEMSGVRTVPAPVERVWHALNDTETLKGCIPGCESIEPDGENAYRMVMAAKVGPVSARFTGKMRLTDIDAPHSYTLHFEGSGGVAGFVNGKARVTLTSDGAGATTLTYATTAQVGGKLAQVGSRLIDGAAQKLTDDSFTRFVAIVSPAVVSPSVETVEGLGAPRARGAGRIAVYLVGAAVAAALVFYLLRVRY
jgi:uncharacterized protein